MDTRTTKALVSGQRHGKHATRRSPCQVCAFSGTNQEKKAGAARLLVRRRRARASRRSGARRRLSGAAGTTRSEPRRRTSRSARPHGREARATRRKAPRSATPRRWSAGSEHAGMVTMLVTAVAAAQDHGAGKEDGRQDEDDAGDDHYPRRGGVQPRRLCALPGRWRRRWCSGDGCRRSGWRFCYFAHSSILPSPAAAVTGWRP